MGFCCTKTSHPIDLRFIWYWRERRIFPTGVGPTLYHNVVVSYHSVITRTRAHDIVRFTGVFSTTNDANSKLKNNYRPLRDIMLITNIWLFSALRRFDGEHSETRFEKHTGYRLQYNRYRLNNNFWLIT